MSGSASAAGDRATVVLRHNRIELGLHRLSTGSAPASAGTSAGATATAPSPVSGPGLAPGARAHRPLLHLHGLGERAPASVPEWLAPWPGPVWALDFTGHGVSTIPVGGGYFCEVLMADADAALAELGEVTIYGRGLGGYVGLLLAGARPDLVRGTIIDDGPGLDGGGSEPGTPYVLTQRLVVDGPPDPYALFELSQDVRPPDYATTYARQAATLSGLDVAIAVSARGEPPWLRAVVLEPGVRRLPVAEALELFAAV